MGGVWNPPPQTDNANYAYFCLGNMFLPSSGPAVSPSWPGLVLFLISSTPPPTPGKVEDQLSVQAKPNSAAQLDEVIFICKPQ